MTPVGAVVRGAAAGAVGTVAMDAFLYARYRRQGGTEQVVPWEFGGPSDWEHVSAPAQVGRRLWEGFTQRTLDARFARLTNNVMHWGYGVAWGGALGVVAASLPRSNAVHGPALGVGVWLSSYVALPLAGLYKPIWQYGLGELAPDLAAHLAYGTVTERTFQLLAYKDT
ncbi:MAG: DUF1440 domain-containing protein [Candidatus Dormibacteraeota bacterium]|nr:DUF1440 domain-containing protein [Candidatus Dormibacteraeota bacterium]